MNNTIIEEVKKRVEPFGVLNYLSYAGSLTYGTSHKDSDLDIQGFFTPHLDYILNIEKVEQVQFESKSKADKKCEGTIFDIRKAFQLWTDCNPNCFEMLYTKNNFVLYCDLVGEQVRASRDIFLSKKIKHTCGGYGYGQFQRMKMLDERENVNKSRIENMKKFGYSTKNACHLIRILNMGYEALVEGTLNVWREDRDFLKRILDGMYKYEEVCKFAEERFSLIEQAYISSTLQHQPNRQEINKLLKQILVETVKRSV